MHINVIGAGLAGCEAAMQIASRGIKVHRYTDTLDCQFRGEETPTV